MATMGNSTQYYARVRGLVFEFKNARDLNDVTNRHLRLFLDQIGCDDQMTLNYSTFCRRPISPMSRDSPCCRRPLRQLPSLPSYSPWVQTSGFPFLNPRHTFPSSCLHRRSCLHSQKHQKTYNSCSRSTHAHYPPLWADCLCSQSDVTMNQPMAALVFAGFARDVKLKNGFLVIGALCNGHVATHCN